MTPGKPHYILEQIWIKGGFFFLLSLTWWDSTLDLVEVCTLHANLLLVIICKLLFWKHVFIFLFFMVGWWAKMSVSSRCDRGQKDHTVICSANVLYLTESYSSQKSRFPWLFWSIMQCLHMKNAETFAQWFHRLSNNLSFIFSFIRQGWSFSMNSSAMLLIGMTTDYLVQCPLLFAVE